MRLGPVQLVNPISPTLPYVSSTCLVSLSFLTLCHLLVSSASSEQPSILSSCSSGSLGGNDITDEGGVVMTSSEVTPGGKVFVMKKQTSLDNPDGPPSQLPVIRKAVIKKNGDIRASLTEEILANEINQQNGISTCTCTYTVFVICKRNLICVFLVLFSF